MAHDVEKFVTGGGIVTIKKLPIGSYTDMGNCPELTVETKTEKLEHFSSRGTFKSKDKSITTQKTATLKIKLDEVAQEQLAMYFQGIIDDQYSIRPLEADELEYAVKFVPDYASGEEWTYEFWRVKISAAGTLNLIKMNEWAELEFEGEILEDVDSHPTNRFWGMTKPTA
ncbi:MAG: hypothetical protein HY913_04425 [Desulfomonile tiedjei]|nr:hypothetical protein [Desulfomonile tiedjei]